MQAMQGYNHQIRPKIVGEMMRPERNRVTLVDEKDLYSLPIGRVGYSWCDNDRMPINHLLDYITTARQAIDAQNIWRQEDDTCHMNGTARMGSDLPNSIVDADCRCWGAKNLWICDG
jgi:choline dehydrogenase-like flavoprotein